jgi:hypothetical protein
MRLFVLSALAVTAFSATMRATSALPPISDHKADMPAGRFGANSGPAAKRTLYLSSPSAR